MQQHTDETGLSYLKVDRNSKKLIILLHGYGASQEDLAPLYTAISGQEKTDWIFPNGTLDVPLGPMMEGRAWFPIDMAELESAMRENRHRSYIDKCPKEFKESVNLVKKFVENQMGQYDEVILGGFSQGAMISTHVAFQIGSKIKKLIIMSGAFIAKDYLDQSRHETSNQIEIFQDHGKQDPLLSFEEAKKLNSYLSETNSKIQFIEFDGEHEIPAKALTSLSVFLQD